jgi:hypothetical protein
MTDEERDIITRFIQRVSGSQSATPGGLPPVDREADQLIGDLFTRYPEARYRLTQTAFVQEAAIKEVQARIRALESELQTTRDALQAARTAPPPVPAQRSSFFASGFGAPPQQAAPQPSGLPQGNPWGPPAVAPAYPSQPPSYPSQPQYAPPPAAPGMMQRGGSGFLGSALTTAAGVAGGVVAGNALMGLFSGHGGGMGGGGFGAGGQPASETIINNNYGDSGQAGYQPPDPGYTPWGEPPEVSGSQALNDGYWSKDSIYQSETGGTDMADAAPPAMPAPDFSDDTDLV